MAREPIIGQARAGTRTFPDRDDARGFVFAQVVYTGLARQPIDLVEMTAEEAVEVASDLLAAATEAFKLRAEAAAELQEAADHG